MFERILRALVLPCLFAILVSGSPSIYQDDQLVRSLRHASCPSCRRERPDALVSWYSEPARRDFRALEPEIGPWSRDDFQPDPPIYDPYDRALGSRGGPPFGRLGSPGKREDPFALEGDVNFDLAPAPTSPLRSLEGPREYQPRYQFPRSMARPSYLNPSFYNKISRDIDLGRSRYYEEPSYDGVGSYEEPVRKPYQRAQNYPDRPFSVERPLVQPQPYPRRSILDNRAPARAPEQFLPRESPAMYSPRVRHDSYNLTPEPSMYKTMQSAGGVEDVANGSSWREQLKRRQEAERQSRIEEYENQQRAKMVQEMRQGNGGRQGNGQFDSRAGEQDDTKGKRGAANENANVEVLGRSKVSWNRLTKSSTEVSSPEMAEAVTEREPKEVTAKTVIVP